MALWDYTAMQSIMEEETTRVVQLSAGSCALLGSALSVMERRYWWENDGVKLTDAEWDTIEGQVAQAYLDIMQSYEAEGAMGKIATLSHNENSGVDAPDAVAGTWVLRPCNSLVDPDGIVTSLSSDRWVLPPGVYIHRIWASQKNAGNHRIGLYNYTTSSFIGLSLGHKRSSHAVLVTSKITLTQETTLFCQHWNEENEGAGLGQAVNVGKPEKYMVVEIEAFDE